MSDAEETFRLALMEHGRAAGLVRIAAAVREIHPEVGAAQFGNLWAKFCGYDGRTMPTHSVETGERL